MTITSRDLTVVIHSVQVGIDDLGYEGWRISFKMRGCLLSSNLTESDGGLSGPEWITSNGIRIGPNETKPEETEMIIRAECGV